MPPQAMPMATPAAAMNAAIVVVSTPNRPRIAMTRTTLRAIDTADAIEAERGIDVPADQPAADETPAKADERATDDPQCDGADDPNPEAHPDIDRDLQRVP